MILGYWEIPGKAQGIRFLLALCHAEHQEKFYSFANYKEWIEVDKVSLGLSFPNLPYLIDGSVRLTESNAIMSYIARTHKREELLGKPEDIHLVEELRFLFTDLQTLGYLSSKNDNESYTQFIAKLRAVHKLMKQQRSIDSTRKFLLNYLTLADLLAWEPLMRLKTHYAEAYAEFADIFDNLLNEIESVKEIQEYLAKPDTPQIPKKKL